MQPQKVISSQSNSQKDSKAITNSQQQEQIFAIPLTFQIEESSRESSGGEASQTKQSFLRKSIFTA